MGDAPADRAAADAVGVHHGYMFITLQVEPALEDLKLYESAYMAQLIADHNAGRFKFVTFTHSSGSSFVGDCNANDDNAKGMAGDGDICDVHHPQFCSPECAFHESNHPGVSVIQKHELSQRMPAGMAILKFAPEGETTTEGEQENAGLNAAIAYYHDPRHQKAMKAGGVGTNILRDVRLCEGPRDLFKAGSGYWYMNVFQIHSQERRSKYLETYSSVLQSGGFRVDYEKKSSGSSDQVMKTQETMVPVFGWPFVSEKRECAAWGPEQEDSYNPSRGLGCAEEGKGVLFFREGTRRPGLPPSMDTWTDADGLVGVTQLGTFEQAMAFRASPDYKRCIFAAVGEEFSEERAADPRCYKTLLDRYSNEVCARDVRVFCCVGIPDEIGV